MLLNTLLYFHTIIICLYFYDCLIHLVQLTICRHHFGAPLCHICLGFGTAPYPVYHPALLTLFHSSPASLKISTVSHFSPLTANVM